MCYEFSTRKKAVKARMENRTPEVSFWNKVNAWVRQAQSARGNRKSGIVAQARQRRAEKITG